MPKISALPVVTSVTDASAKIVVVEGGVTSAITADNLAADSAFTSRYKPLTADTLHASAASISAGDGAPTLAMQFASAAWFVAKGESVSTSFVIPPGWATVTLVVHWTNAGGVAGNAYFFAQTMHVAEGAAITTLSTETILDAGGTGVNDLIESPTATGAYAVTPGRLFGVRLTRVNDVLDTIGASDIAILGITIVRAS